MSEGKFPRCLKCGKEIQRIGYTEYPMENIGKICATISCPHCLSIFCSEIRLMTQTEIQQYTKGVTA